MEKNNKLIAEFMGCTHPFNDITDATLYLVSHGTFNSSELTMAAMVLVSFGRQGPPKPLIPSPQFR